MSLQQEQRMLKALNENRNYHAIQIITTNQNFEDRYGGSVSAFFRSLKNGLYSVNGITNRDYFKGISGVYFSLEDLDNYEIIIVYDTTIKRLHKVQVITRLMKLLGYDIEVNFGPLDEYLSRINEMMGIRRRSQYFGDNYFKKIDSEKSLR